MCLSWFPPPQVFHIPEKDFQVIQIKTWKSSFISSFLLSIPNIYQQDLEILSPSFTPYPHSHHLRSVWHHILFILLEPPLKNVIVLVSGVQQSESLTCVCVSNSSQPHGLRPGRLLWPWYFPSKNTGVGCHFLLLGIFPTHASNPHILRPLHWQAESVISIHTSTLFFILFPYRSLQSLEYSSWVGSY